VRDGAQVVKKLAQQIPSAFALHHVGAKQQVPGNFDRLFQKEFPAPLRPDVTQSLIGQSLWSVRSLGRRGKPALVNAAAVAAERVEIIRV
jgi:hypothetical protein